MKLSLVIPTYNEKENIQKLIKKIQKECDILRALKDTASRRLQ